MLEINELQVVYSRVALAIQEASIKVPQTSIVAVVGTNGAGKTTLARAISGFLPSDYCAITKGEIKFQGEKISGLPPHKNAKKGIIIVPEREKIFQTLTISENLNFYSTPKGKVPFSYEEIFQYFPALKKCKANLMAGYLSGGERQMLAIGQALLCQPKLLLLDEFSLGLAPMIVMHLAEAIRRMKVELGLTIFLLEQSAEVALKIADHGYVMVTGRIVSNGTPESLLCQGMQKQSYHGIKEEWVKTYLREKRDQNIFME